ncbi:MAG: winged helix-turn-helix transcriptional regulator [bacterium]|nr:winged helix-turn-helix transcriptional regulator [bacterium]
MDNEKHSLETSLSFRLLKIAHAVQWRHQRALGGTPLTLSQYWVLKLVCDGIASRPSEVARRLGVHPGDVTRLIKGLSARGLLTRSRRGDDQRNLHLAATPKGEQVASAAARWSRRPRPNCGPSWGRRRRPCCSTVSPPSGTSASVEPPARNAGSPRELLRDRTPQRRRRSRHDPRAESARGP